MRKNLASITAAMIGLIASVKWFNDDTVGKSNNKFAVKNAKLQAELMWHMPIRRMPLPLWLFGYVTLCHPVFTKIFWLIFFWARKAMMGVWMRKMYMEKQVRNFLEDHQGKDVQVLIVAAGYDTLAWRLAGEYPNAKFIELDHPATGQAKLESMNGVKASRKLKRHDKNIGGDKIGNSTSAYQSTKLPNNLYLCHAEVGNNSTISMKDALHNFVFLADDCDDEHYDDFISGRRQSDNSKNCFRISNVPTAIVAEGLTMYLTKEENMSMIQQLEELFGSDGSTVSISYVKFDKYNKINEHTSSNTFLGRFLKYGVKIVGENHKFGTAPKHIHGLFEGTKWNLLPGAETWEDESFVVDNNSVRVGVEYVATAKWKA